MRNLSITTGWMLALVVVVAGCAGCWLWCRGGAWLDSSRRLESAEPEKAGALRVDDGSQELTNLREVLPAAEPASETQSAEPTTGIAWSGTVNFEVERTDTELAQPSLPSVGELSLTFRNRDGTTERVRTPVQGKTWRCELPFRPESIDEVRVRGLVERSGVWRPAAGRETLPLEFDSLASVRLVRATPSWLRVVDARTGALLPQVRLDFTQVQPSPTRHLSLDWGQSFRTQPIELVPHSPQATDLDGTWLVRVGAPGFVASALAVEFGTGRTYEVRLQRAGSARLCWPWPEDEAWQAAARARDARLQLSIDPVDPTPTPLDGPRGLEGSWSAETSSREHLTDRAPDAPLREWVQEAEGLEPGEHIATLSLRARPCESALAIATARFLVHAGERTEVRLERLPATPSADPLVRLEFLGDTRFLRDGAGAVSVRKRIGMGWSDSQALSFRPDSAETEPTRMEPGAFELTVTGAAAFRRTFEVLGATDQLVLIELASLRRIRVSLDAGAASSELLPRTLRWCRVEDRANENRVHSRGSELGTFELLSASLPIELWLYDERQLRFAEGQRVRIEQDGDVRVRMVENPRLTLRFVDDQRRFHAPRYASVFTRFCPGGNELALAASIGKDSSGSIDEVRVWFPEAGAYELELPEFEGFESLAPLSVHVIADAVPMFEVPLVRKR